MAWDANAWHIRAPEETTLCKSSRSGSRLMDAESSDVAEAGMVVEVNAIFLENIATTGYKSKSGITDAKCRANTAWCQDCSDRLGGQ
jgi:hypothetical protein